MPLTALAVVDDDLEPDELTAAEALELDRAEQLDSGTLVEELTYVAHGVTYRHDTTTGELRRLAALALALARRMDRPTPDD